jgi:hypothetical protein
LIRSNFKRWLGRVILVLLVLLALVYAGDYCALRYKIPSGRPQFAQITVNDLYVIHVKGGKTQFEPGDQETDTCVNSLFPHMGYSPCWYLRKHTDKLINI